MIFSPVPSTPDEEADRETTEALLHLEQRIKSVRQSALPEEKYKENSASNGVRMVWHIGTEMVAGVAVGAFVGVWMDRWFDTAPWFFLLCFLLGCAASGLSIYRLVQKTDIEDPEKLYRNNGQDNGQDNGDT